MSSVSNDDGDGNKIVQKNPPRQKLSGEWVLAFGEVTSGIVWVGHA